MNHARDHFFSHAAFAADEYRHVDRRDLQNLLADLQHLRAGREERDIFGEGFAVFAQCLVFRAKLLLLAALQERGIELRLFERLGQVVERAQANRFDHGGDFVRARQHDHVQRAVDLHQLPQRLETVHFRHQHVENDEVGPFAVADRARALPCRWAPFRRRIHRLREASADISGCSVRRRLPESFLYSAITCSLWRDESCLCLILFAHANRQQETRTSFRGPVRYRPILSRDAPGSSAS